MLVRAIILGLLLPATNDPEADRKTFLALMGMDDAGMLRRLDGALSAQAVYDLCTAREREEYFTADNTNRDGVGKSEEPNARLFNVGLFCAWATISG